MTGNINAIVSPLGTETVSPYFGGGIGYTYWEEEVTSIGGVACTSCDSNESALNAQGILGIDFSVAQDMTLGLQYRYTWLDSGEGAVDDLTTHSALATLHFAL